MNYRFEPTGEVREPLYGEMWLDGDMITEAECCYGSKVPIYRRVPHEDTSCEVAFARMVLAMDQGENADEDELTYQRLRVRMELGDRSAALTAAMQTLTEKNTHTTPRGEA